MHNDKDDYDLGREIERSWLIRGEYHKVVEAKGTAFLVFVGVFVVGIILCYLVKALGIQW